MGEWMYRSTFSWPRYYLEVSGQLHSPTSLAPRKEPRYPLDRRLSGPKTGLDDMEKRKFLTLPGLELRHFSRPARNQSLYRLRYPGSQNLQYCVYYVRKVCLSVCSHETNFYDIWYLGISAKLVDRLQSWLQLDKNRDCIWSIQLTEYLLEWRCFDRKLQRRWNTLCMLKTFSGEVLGSLS
jgi:hypothetical protein